MKKVLSSSLKRPVMVGRIQYVNVDPVYFGFDQGVKPEWMKIVKRTPSVLNDMMACGQLDVSPVSSTEYARHQDEWIILPGLSIGCFGPVMSVLLVSKYPVAKLDRKRVLLTKESATSAELLKLIFAKRKVDPVLEFGPVPTPGEIPREIGAALVIGDPALNGRWSDCFEYTIDLGQMWFDLTDLPFVFAIWAARRSFAREHPNVVASIVELFIDSKRAGQSNIEKIVVKASKKLAIKREICRRYYDLLLYDLDTSKVKGLEAFFSELLNEKILSERVRLNFFSGSRNVVSPAHSR